MSVNCLLILDGFGENPESFGNAIVKEGTPYINSLKQKYPYVNIGASGMDVGLPDGQMGNSEVGHLNMGAGRIVYQELTRISKSIDDGDFFTNPAFVNALNYAKENGKAVHLMGLTSNGGVHSHTKHYFALIELCKKMGVKDCFIHCFMDGRDVPPMSGIDFIQELENKTNDLQYGKIATIMGRYYAMDRDNRWERVEKAYNCMTAGEGLTFRNAREAIKSSYDRGITDEFIEPSIIVHQNKKITSIMEGDAIIFFNFRPDRAREITRAFIEKDFDSFERKTGYLAPKYVSLTQYHKDFTNLEIAFKPQTLENTFGEYLAKKGIKQLRIAETEKYAHVTFFFNGGVEAPNEGEDRILIPSPKVATYDMQPEMSIYEVTRNAVENIKSQKYEVVIINFANCDMVGHTGVFDAAVKAVAAVDDCVKQVVEAIKSVDGSIIITADHGNADMMMEKSGAPFTAHTTNPVPFIIVNDKLIGSKLKDGGRLCDVVPTMLDIMGIEKPKEMTGSSLLK